MKNLYKAPQSECIELVHRESVMLTGSTTSAPEKDNMEFESISKGWSSSVWNGQDEVAED